MEKCNKIVKQLQKSAFKYMGIHQMNNRKCYYSHKIKNLTETGKDMNNKQRDVPYLWSDILDTIYCKSISGRAWDQT